MREKRTCGWCDKPIYYGLMCSNECADKSYEQWKKNNPTILTESVRM